MAAANWDVEPGFSSFTLYAAEQMGAGRLELCSVNFQPRFTAQTSGIIKQLIQEVSRS